MQKALAEMFKSAKDGDSICTLNKSIISYFITKATNGQSSHAAKIYNVDRLEDQVMFDLSEQTFFGGRLNKVIIVKTSNNTYKLKGINGLKRIWYLQVKPEYKMNLKAGFNDAVEQIGKKYGYTSLWLGFAFLEKFLPKTIQDKIHITRLERKRVCTEHCIINDKILGLPAEEIYTKDFFITPQEYKEFKYFNVYGE